MEQDVSVKPYALGGNKVKKNYFYHKGQGHKVIDLGVSLKGIINGVCMPYMKSLCLFKVIAKVDNRKTRQKQFAPKHSVWGHENIAKLQVKNIKFIYIKSQISQYYMFV